MSLSCDVITVVLFKGEFVCVTMTSDRISAVLFEGEIGCVKGEK